MVNKSGRSSCSIFDVDKIITGRQNERVGEGDYSTTKMQKAPDDNSQTYDKQLELQDG